MIAVGRLSMPASRLASDDLPELISPRIAIRSGRSSRASVRDSARIAQDSRSSGDAARSRLRRACLKFSTSFVVGPCAFSSAPPIPVEERLCCSSRLLGTRYPDAVALITTLNAPPLTSPAVGLHKKERSLSDADALINH